MVVAVFAIGSATRWTVCVTTALALACVVPYLRSSREMTAPSPLLVFLAAAAGLTLVQLVPLPAVLLELVSPHKHELVAANAAALGEEPPSFMSLSLDPPATLLELAKLLGFFGFAYAAVRVAPTARGRRWLLTGVGALGGAVALTALAHQAAGAERLFGLYQPRNMAAPPYMAPLLNPNHLAGFLAMTTPVSLALVVTNRSRWRLLWVVTAVLSGSVCLLTESRGGAIALAAGILVAAALWIVQRRAAPQATRKPRSSETIAKIIAGLAGLVLLGALTATGAIAELERTGDQGVEEEARWRIWKSSAVLLRDYRWTGVGRGAFEPAFTSAHDSPRTTFSHLENEYLQAAVDWGILGAGALAVAVLWTLIVATRRSRVSPLEAGALGGLAAIALRSLTDFGLALPGVAIPALAVAAPLVYLPVRRRTEGTRALPVARLVGLGAAVLVLAATLSPLATPMRTDSDRVRTLLDGPDGATDARAAAAKAFRRHPADYLSAALLARTLAASRDPRAVPVANRALALNPSHPGMHQLAAHMLLHSQQPAQAMVEYSLAMRLTTRHAAVLDDLLRRVPDPAQAARGLPLDEGLAERLVGLLEARKRLDVAAAYLDHFVGLYPRSAVAHRLRARVALRQREPGLAVESAERAHELDPGPETAMALGAALRGADRPAEAVPVLRAILDGPARPSQRLVLLRLHQALAEAEVASGQLDAAKATLNTALQYTDRRGTAPIHRKLAEVEEKLGNANRAQWHRREADAVSGN